MPVNPRIDVSDALAGLAGLAQVRHRLARSMAVAGGSQIRDEAKARAPVESGALRDAVYLAYRDGRSTESQVVYSVSWNKKKAPHGHLIEFGHWQTRVAYQGSDGNWYSGAPLAAPRWVPAVPFLRPAYDAVLPRLANVMVERARDRLPELLRGLYTPDDDEFV